MMKPSILLLVPVLGLTSYSFADTPQATAPQEVLPLRQVVLFSSGVGYFGRSGQVTGDADVDLHFRAPQISDILKSLVLFDAKGTVRPVTYSIEDYVAARARETDLNIDPNSSPGAILRTLQGAMIHLEKGGTVIEGRIISVSSMEVPIKEGDTFRTVESVTLLTATGMQTIRLDDVTSFTPIDPRIKAKFASSLEKRAANLTNQLDDGVRSVSLHFSGKGTRDIRAGYLQENPTWKTSYRLVLAPKQKPYLQGWAVVENPSDEDWNNVQLSLVSGRPISFIQNMAVPVYITRPVVDNIIPNGSPSPQTFGSGYNDESLKGRITALENKPMAPAANGAILAGNGFGGGGFGGAASRGGGIFSNSGAYTAADGANVTRDMAEAINQSQVSPQASGETKGDLFVYAVDNLVTLPRGQAAMVPIVGENVDGEAISIVVSQNQVGPLTPTNGFCLRNTGGLHLQGGPITVYNDGVYGGDALVTNVSPGESRLISYALDLDMTARLDREENNSTVLGVSASDGVLTISRRATKSQVYALKNKTALAKTVYIQQPGLAGWDLIDPKQVYEKSNEGWRFKTTVEPKKSEEYAIKWQQNIGDTVIVRDLNVGQIAFYAAYKEAPPELKQALQNIIVLRKKQADLAAQRAAQEKMLKDIQEDQSRIRQNMGVLNQESPLYKTYAAKLATQETQIDKIGTEIERLRGLEAEAKAATDAAISALNTN